MGKKEWVDFKAVKEAVTMQMVLDHYGITGLRKKGEEMRGDCPIDSSCGPRSFTVNLSKNAFNCFSCKVRGNVLDFVAAMDKCSVKDAALKLAECFKIGESEQPAQAMTDEIQRRLAVRELALMALAICLPSEVLARAGFNSGDRFSIECTPGKITLVKVEDSS